MLMVRPLPLCAGAVGAVCACWSGAAVGSMSASDSASE